MKKEPKRTEDQDLSEVFDLDRKGLTKKLVSDFEDCLHNVMLAHEERRAVVKSAMEAQFSRRDIVMMQRLAKLRLDNKLGRISEEMDALERISAALGIEIFNPETRTRLRLKFREDDE